jgi:hypothetical protein
MTDDNPFESVSESSEEPVRGPRVDEGPLDDRIVAYLDQHDDGAGVSYDEIAKHFTGQGFSQQAVEEAVNALLGRGRVFEPVLGTFKVT